MSWVIVAVHPQQPGFQSVRWFWTGTHWDFERWAKEYETKEGADKRAVELAVAIDLMLVPSDGIVVQVEELTRP